MVRSFLTSLLTLVALATSLSCTDGSDANEQAAASTRPDGFFQALEKARDGRPQAIWHALPAGYRSDVDALIEAFAGRMDEQVWNKSFELLGKALDVLDRKREYVLGYPLVAMMTAQADKEELNAAIDATVRMLRNIVESEVKTLDGLKGLDVESFLAGTIGDTIRGLTESIETMGGGMSPDAALLGETFTTRVVSESGDQATVEVEFADGEKKTAAMTRVEGVWIPREMAEGWQQGMEEARAAIDGLEMTGEERSQALTAMAAVDGLLDQLLSAPSQEAFDAAVAGAMQMFGEMGG